VVVEAGWLADTGDPKLRLISNARATTNQKGEFVIPDIPAHLPVVVGVNLNSAPNRTYRFDPVYAPDSTQSLESAKPFQLKPGAAVTGASIRMPDPLPFGDLYVEVLWPDGTPANGGAFASATADNGSRAGEAKAGDHETNRVRLELALNRDYSIRGIWLLFDPEYVRIEGESPAKIHFNRHGQTVRVTLKEKWPSPGR
jgi:hypothetical protein